MDEGEGRRSSGCRSSAISSLMSVGDRFMAMLALSPHGYRNSTVREGGTLVDGSEELSKLQVGNARWRISHAE